MKGGDGDSNRHRTRASWRQCNTFFFSPSENIETCSVDSGFLVADDARRHSVFLYASKRTRRRTVFLVRRTDIILKPLHAPHQHDMHERRTTSDERRALHELLELHRKGSFGRHIWGAIEWHGEGAGISAIDGVLQDVTKNLWDYPVQHLGVEFTHLADTI